MTKSVMRRVVDRIWPDGPIWNIAIGDAYDKFVNGMSKNFQDVKDFLGTLADIRNPRKTTLLEDLEKEYGVVSDSNIIDAERRDRLAELVYAPDSGGDQDFLEARLRGAGFDVRVHANDPPVDPNDFLDLFIGSQCGDTDAQCGETLVQAGYSSSEKIIVAGDISKNVFVFTSQSGKAGVQSGVSGVQSGSAFFDLSPIEYPDPTDPERWPFVFFVGGDSHRQQLNDSDMEKAGTDDWSSTFATLSKSVTEMHTGLQSMQVTTVGLNLSPFMLQKIYFVPIGTTINISVWVKVAAGFVFGRLLAEHDTGGSTIVDNTVTIGSWVNLSGTYVTTKNEPVSVLVTFDGSPIVETAGYVDDFVADYDGAKTGEIQDIDLAQVPFDRRDEFLRTILKWKPERSWGVAVVEYV